MNLFILIYPFVNLYKLKFANSAVNQKYNRMSIYINHKFCFFKRRSGKAAK